MTEQPELFPLPEQDLLAGPPKRLLKTWQDPALIRRMDRVILASRGAYTDRNDFIAEALGDRIEAEEQLRGLAATHDLRPPGEQEPAATGANQPERFGDWLSAAVPTGAPTQGPETNFGLHNRDYPTLWAADCLGRMTATEGQPVRWSAFVAQATERAWKHAAQLGEADLERGAELGAAPKLTAGFPTNVRKREAAEARFRDHSLGLVTSRGVRGPLFVLGLVRLEEQMAMLSAPAVRLLAQLHEAGVGNGPPFSAAAWSAFSDHLASHAPAELSTWRRVLRVIADEPDRRALVDRCDWWSGSTADTNVMGYVARGREWGLVEIGMVDGSYALTHRGAAEPSRSWEAA